INLSYSPTASALQPFTTNLSTQLSTASVDNNISERQQPHQQTQSLHKQATSVSARRICTSELYLYKRCMPVTGKAESAQPSEQTQCLQACHRGYDPLLQSDKVPVF